MQSRIHPLVWRIVVLALVAAAATPARAQADVTAQPVRVVDAGAPAEPPTISVVQQQPAPRRRSIVGLTFDLGMPDVVGVALALRPVWWLRVQAGGSTDLFSGGLGGGVTFVPLRRLLSPSITLAGGHVFASESLNVPSIVGVNADHQRIGYDYATLHAGLEIGAQKRLSISIQGGVSFVNLTAVPDGTQPSNFTTATLRVWTPSGRVALTVFL